ncbi:hypothetical protein SAMN04515666_1069 [Bosea lupini]|uniref:Succinylglutamate desuccinylase/Aspartoacylase catalytic domain-containing protein n=1 Tax=Bosea lupini TaxID=1036779 RepID=A0A1H7TWZ2_9HYPH|nr:succinylglutamate desuccinylase/aspartoacylase family protein [Bosea lupini]SEL89019.1 hypothetical protein SAMN04515666_1069 [Bosea lupini]
MKRPRDGFSASKLGISAVVTDISADRIFGLTEDLPTTGRHAGFVKIPHSSDRSAYGFVPVPLAIVGGGAGPTMLLLGGVFGDEVDTQIAVARLLRLLDPKTMNGRVIAMTMANLPAAMSGTRNSPIDGRNLNKSFPGDVFGSPTSMIAEYIERHLMSLSDLVIDLHSDGRSLGYLPCVTLVDHPDPDVQSRRLAMARAFGGENLLRFRSFEDRSTSGAARRAGATRIGTEIGGAQPVTTIMDGIMRVLAWAGIITQLMPASGDARLLVTQREDDFVYALADGVFEPAVQLGDEVAAGDLAGHIHDLTRPFAVPIAVTFALPGVVICTRGRGHASRGDCLVHLAADADAEARAELDAAADLRWLSTQVAPPAKRSRGGARAQPAAKAGRKPNKTTHQEE